MAIGKAGAKNAGIYAARILALSDVALAARLTQFRLEMAAAVEKKDQALQQRLAEL